MHHDRDSILAGASEPNEYGTRTATVKLEPGDTAFAPGTTKYHLLGHGKGGRVHYRFFREGIDATTEGQVARSLIDPQG